MGDVLESGVVGLGRCKGTAQPFAIAGIVHGLAVDRALQPFDRGNQPLGRLLDPGHVPHQVSR